eukprot:5566920-Pyramimonas_sp.AAC.1
MRKRIGPTTGPCPPDRRGLVRRISQKPSLTGALSKQRPRQKFTGSANVSRPVSAVAKHSSAANARQNRTTR